MSDTFTAAFNANAIEAAQDNSNASYILIENPGVAAPEAFTLLGASDKAGTDAIGQFGSGTKFGTLVCLRKEIPPVVFCGTLKLAFGTKDVEFNGARHEQVQVKVSGKDRTGKTVNRTEDLSVVLKYGSLDWKDKVELALREFVSNALDATQGDASQIKVEIVNTPPRAKAGFTRVYVPLTDDGRAFVDNIGEWFLHFAGRVWKESCLIHKNTPSKAKVYRRGVLVRTVDTDKDSLYDYNLNELPLDEARISSDWNLRYYAARAVRKCTDAAVIGRIFARSANAWEGTFDLSSVDYGETAETQVKRTATWKKAVETVLPPDTIILSETEDDSFAKGKGYKVVRVNDAVYQAAKKHGLRTTDTILTQDERNGRQVDAVATPGAWACVKVVWEKLLDAGVCNGEAFPQVKTFSEVGSSGESSCHGYYRDGTVFLNNKLLSGTTLSDELYSTILEELAHYITKATDNSRDFQNWFITVCVKLFRTK